MKKKDEPIRLTAAQKVTGALAGAYQKINPKAFPPGGKKEKN